MQKHHCSWLRIALLTLVLFSNLTLAIDNPDAPDLITEFTAREKPFIAAIEKPTNTTTDFSIAYANYQDFLDKELNKVYKALRKNLPADKQKQLKASQVNWLKYRDLEFAFIDSTWNNIDFGSSSAISRGQYRARLIRNRVVQLMTYVRAY